MLPGASGSAYAERMATQPPRPCARPGCSKLVPRPGRFCPQHSAREADHHRAAERVRSAERAAWYGPDWRRVRAAHLATHPACEHCGSRERLEVHHRIAVRMRPDLRLVDANLLTVCLRCHSRITAVEGGWAGRHD